MITKISLISIYPYTKLLLTLFLMLYIIYPWLIYYITAGLYLVIPFTYFAHSSPPFLLANTCLLSVSMSLFSFCFICLVFIYLFIFLNLFFFKFIYFWLCWVFIAARGLSLVAASGGYSSLRCAGFSLQWLLSLWSMGSRRVGFGSCGTRAQ